MHLNIYLIPMTALLSEVTVEKAAVVVVVMEGVELDSDADVLFVVTV